MKFKQQFDQLGVRFIAVGNGSILFAKKFKQSVPFEGEVFIDPQSAAFKAANLPRLTIWQVTKRFILNLTALSFYRGATAKYPGSDVEGDGQQTGGVFVVGPGIGGDIYYSFRENETDPTTFANPEEIMAACQK